MADGLHCDAEGSLQISIPSPALWLVQSILTKWIQAELKEVSGWYLLVDTISASLRSLGGGVWLVILDVGGTVAIIILVIILSS